MKFLRKNVRIQLLIKIKFPDNFIFPINHPIDGCIYLSSIVDNNVFYPLSEYHQKLKHRNKCWYKF